MGSLVYSDPAIQYRLMALELDLGQGQDGFGPIDLAVCFPSLISLMALYRLKQGPAARRNPRGRRAVDVLAGS